MQSTRGKMAEDCFGLCPRNDMGVSSRSDTGWVAAMSFLSVIAKERSDCGNLPLSFIRHSPLS